MRRTQYVLKEKIDKMLTSWRKLTGRSKERRKTPQQNCDEQVVCVSVCVQTSVHAHMCVLAGHGGESLVFQAEGPAEPRAGWQESPGLSGSLSAAVSVRETHSVKWSCQQDPGEGEQGLSAGLQLWGRRLPAPGSPPSPAWASLTPQPTGSSTALGAHL